MAIFHIKLIQLPVGFSLGIRHVGVSFLDPSRLACSTNSGLSWKVARRIRHNVDFWAEMGSNMIEVTKDVSLSMKNVVLPCYHLVI